MSTVSSKPPKWQAVIPAKNSFSYRQGHRKININEFSSENKHFKYAQSRSSAEVVHFGPLHSTTYSHDLLLTLTRAASQITTANLRDIASTL